MAEEGARPCHPLDLVVATDGSFDANRAVAVAVALAGRLKADLEAVVAIGDGDLDPDGIESGCNSPAAAGSLCAGWRARPWPCCGRSVSERVAHGSDASVLVVR